MNRLPMFKDNDKDRERRLLEKKLSAAGLDISACEAHGLLSGVFVASNNEADWEIHLFDDADNYDLSVRDCRQALRQLFAKIRAEFSASSTRFSLMLPSDTQALQQRSMGLVEWCQGFLFGIGTAGTDASSLSARAREAVADIVEITRLDLDDADASEENEQAYTDLVEFVWVAAVLIHEELFESKEART